MLVEKTGSVRSGEIVVAGLVDGMETTLKRFFDEGDMIRLQPANPPWNLSGFRNAAYKSRGGFWPYCVNTRKRR